MWWDRQGVEHPGAWVPMLVYAGERDTVTPAEQAIHLKSAPGPVDLRIVPKAGHFRFMNVLPPGITEDAAFDRDRFLRDLAQTTTEFVTSTTLSDVRGK